MEEEITQIRWKQNSIIDDPGDQQQHHQQQQGGGGGNTFDCTGGAVTGATWTSAFDVACWVNPLYYVEEGESSRGSQEEEGQRQCTTAAAAPATGEDTAAPPILKTPQQQKEDDEVLGWALDSFARGVVVIAIACFVSTELLRLAKEAAACPEVEYSDEYYDDNDDDDNINDMNEEIWEMVECDARVYGIKPSSLLTNLVMCTSLISAFMMPLIGSIIDHTYYRRAVASGSAITISILTLVQMLVMQREDLWYIAALLQVGIAFSYQVHLCAVYAYLPELTHCHEVLATYTSRFVAVQYAGSVSLLVFMIVILSIINRDDEFNVITLCNTTVFVVCSTLWGYSWLKLFRSRPPRQQVPPGRSLLSAGFWKIYKTGRTILREHNAIKWCLVAASCTNAALVTFSTIAITYLTEQLQFTAKENGICILILLIFSLPGTRIAQYMTNKYNPLKSIQVCLVVWIINTTACACFCYAPTHALLAYFFAMVWGIVIGWVYPTEKTLYVTIIPKGQEAELMGTYICAGSLLAWLPPLVFTIMNEIGMSMRIGLFSITFYYMGSLIALWKMGSHQDAVEHAQQIDEGKLEFAIAPSSGLIRGCYDDGITGCYEQWDDDILDELDILGVLPKTSSLEQKDSSNSNNSGTAAQQQ